MIIDRDSNPKDTVYYIAACTMEIISLNKYKYNVDEVFNILKARYNDSLEYTVYLLSLNFLFLINKISIGKEDLLNVYKAFSY